MKYVILLILIGNSYLQAQIIEGGYLKLCAGLESSEAQIACTDSTLLEDVKIGWSEIKSQIKPGKYLVTYSINSIGQTKAERVITVPQRVVLNSSPELLLKLVGTSLQKYEWIYPKSDYFDEGNEKISVVIQRNLKIDTTLL